MPPRTLFLIIFAAVLGFGSTASARTWKTVAEYVLKNGAQSTLKAPSSRMLGFDSDAVPSRGLRIKAEAAKDKKEHAVHATYESDERGVMTPKEIVLGVTLVSETAGKKAVEGYKMRITLDGKIVAVMRAAGVVGEVEQTAVAPDSKEALAVYGAESRLHLKANALEQLTR
jgi:hypothetical protein